MKKSLVTTLAAVALFATASIANAQYSVRYEAVPTLAQSAPTLPAPGTSWSGAGYYDLKSHNVSAVALTNIRTFAGILGHPAWTLDLDGFAGITARKAQSQQAIAGFSLGRHFPFASGIDLYAGLAATFAASQPVGFGLIAGVSIKF